jgi:hypothetical protein
VKAINPHRIKPLRRGRRLWKPEEIAKLRRLYPDAKASTLVRVFHRPMCQIYTAAARYGLEKSAAFHANAKLSGRFDKLSRAGDRYRFPKGHVPANKGLRRPGYAPGRMRETQFKKGEMTGAAQHNYRPIGSTRIVYGNLERKVTDDPSIYPAKRWRPIHRMLWEAANGPVPAGHKVVFKPGRHTAIESEITLDRIELVSDAELMRRNTIHVRLPKPLRHAVQVLGQLTRRIRQKEKALASQH